mmetsp:Transcript_23995/g.44601  ORF Transcript_23995/g.44601 Transcript_23995/m.44601 type:complete len:109 (-) Transcript_23995:360-686(-)
MSHDGCRYRLIWEKAELWSRKCLRVSWCWKISNTTKRRDERIYQEAHSCQVGIEKCKRIFSRHDVEIAIIVQDYFPIGFCSSSIAFHPIAPVKKSLAFFLFLILLKKG